MALPSFPLFIDELDPTLNGLYPTFASQSKTTTMAAVRDKSLYLAIVAMQANYSGSAPWTATDISTATVRVSIDNPDLFPSQGAFYLNDGSGPTSALSTVLPPLTAILIQNALNALATTTSAGGLTVNQIGQDFIFTWNNNGPQPLLTASLGSLYPASSITITELQLGTSSSPEIQSINISQLPATYQSTFTLTAGTPATMNGILSLNTPGMLARFDSLPIGMQSFNATLQVDIQFPAQDPQTILLLPVTVHRDVIKSGIGALPPFAYPARADAFGNPLVYDQVTTKWYGLGLNNGTLYPINWP